MKLKTEFQDEDFKLGEVADVNIATMPDGRIKAQAVAKSGGVHTFFYDDLKTFTDDWEDAPEEPKEYWYIDEFGLVQKEIEYYYEENKEAVHDKRIAVGNYFETREEAEKAVEKLKAFANLRKRGLKFNGWDEADRGMVGEFAIYCDVLELDGIERELEIVFGREEL